MLAVGAGTSRESNVVRYGSAKSPFATFRFVTLKILDFASALLFLVVHRASGAARRGAGLVRVATACRHVA